jgi:regulator of CtrA degradation
VAAAENDKNGGALMTGFPDRPQPPEAGFVSFGERMLGSANFRALFQQGMALVEETAAYLDGDGRLDAKALPRPVALAYATESMRLTTRLMQVASWLLIQRATNEGEMTPDQAAAEKAKVKLTTFRAPVSPETFDSLPAELRSLMARADRLNQRVLLLERQLAEGTAPAAPGPNPVASQRDLISTAFGRGFG